MLLALGLSLLVVPGCSTHNSAGPSAPTPQTPQSQPADNAAAAPAATSSLEGAWQGPPPAHADEQRVSLVFTGQTLEFHGAQPNEWLKGTFTVREDTTPKQLIATATECSSPDDVGKKDFAIYKLEDGRLIITGSHLGDEKFPSDFDDPDDMKLVLERAK